MRPLDRLPGAARVTAWTPNPEQRAAIEARGRVLLSAGAGTGKTAVLVERFARAVCDEGLDVDSVLAITYTRRAAGELRGRIRAALLERGRHDLARELDGAWISTIHGFCNRLLKSYPFAAGLDPRFRELDEAQGSVVRSEAFERALTDFCSSDEPARLALLASYGSRRLRTMLIGVYETLRSAGRELVLSLGEARSLPERLGELVEAARCLAADAAATEAQIAAARGLLDLLDRDPIPDRLLDLTAFRTRGERAASFEEARRGVEQAALDRLAARDRDLLQELLERFAGEYAAAKERESLVDFEDLQLRARDLLRDHPEVREREQLRFRSIMVDEFQDTNRLQCELVDLLAGGPSTPELFFVGDEFQSIYGFRHADVQVFRERREREGGGLALTRNYRSRPEVLAAVNHLFEADFGEGFQPLAASAEFPDPVFGHPVELLVTDKSTYAETGVHWRRGEARHIARRVRELVDSGAAAPGEIVLLFAAGTDAEWYEEELRRQGLPTSRATGRGYFGQQQVVDVLSYLRLLHNRYDDQALLTVLASPFVGVSNDALVLIRRAAPRRPLFTAIERVLPPELDERDAQLLRAFRQRYERLVSASTRLSLERLCELVVGEHDYDLAVLAQWDGRRRFANIRKLARLARSYEELRGPDIEGFVRFVRDQEALGARELEAVAEEEGADAVRLLTIHAAKGLEFKVVVVADAGRDRQPPSGDDILALSDGRFGFRVADPLTSVRRAAFAYEDVKERLVQEEREERLRLYYVAMTRAIDRLIVSGAIDPGRPAEAQTPIGWVLGRLDAEAELAGALEEPVELERGAARLLVRVDRYRPELHVPPAEPERAAEPETGQLVLFSALPEPARSPALTLPPLEPVPPAPAHALRSLSYSALALFGTCSYRYYAERVAGLRPTDAGRGDRSDRPGLAATEVGDAVHRLLELVALHAPKPPDTELVRAWYPAVSDEELERIGSLVEAYCESDLAARVAALEDARPERSFAFEHDGVLLHGRLDVLHRGGERALVVDYKTNVLGESSPEEIVESEYGLQRLVYALALLRGGAKEVEVAYQFLERPAEVVSCVFGRADVPELEGVLSKAIAAIQAGGFHPSPSEFACRTCPALDVVCAGPRLRGRAEQEPAATAALA
ncbi:MAG: UvrD-helicase domain-containing protein [Actinobacteria bacterium]|nr:UvrD-helicase domain-containing protein [Actinomycetota bacterium]